MLSLNLSLEADSERNDYDFIFCWEGWLFLGAGCIAGLLGSISIVYFTVNQLSSVLSR